MSLMRVLIPLLVAGFATISTTVTSPVVDEQGRGPARTISPNPGPLPPMVDVPVEEASHGYTRLFFSDECTNAKEGFNLVVHFHGAPHVIKHELAASRLNAAVLVKNVGIVSKPYRKRYSHAWTLDRLTSEASRLVAKQCNLEVTHVRRLALSAWSAGFAAVGGILQRSDASQRVEAILLADGLHAAFIERSRRELYPLSLSTFKAFAEDAVRGERLMVVTHSQIVTEKYASTTESANFLLEHLGLEREEPDRGFGPEGMQMLSSVSMGGFHLQEYAGTDARAHGQHLHAVGHLLFAPLREFWSLVPEDNAEFGTARDPVTVTVNIRDDMYCTRSPSSVECRAAAQ